MPHQADSSHQVESLWTYKSLQCRVYMMNLLLKKNEEKKWAVNPCVRLIVQRNRMGSIRE